MIIPTLAAAAPGNFLTAALWNATVVAGVTAALNPAIFKGYGTGGQSIPGSATTPIPVLLDTEEIDTDGGHSIASNTSRFVVQTAGVYMAMGAVTYSTASATGVRAAEILKNGTGQPGGIQQVAPSSTRGGSANTFIVTRCAVGDYIELATWTTGATDTLASSSMHFYPTLTVIRLSS